MDRMPRDKRPDASLALAREPYLFISKTCRCYESDVVSTRLLLQNTICMTGSEAAEIFYDRSRFTREGAAPGRLQKTLFGRGGVQGLDGDAHRHRKAMFMSLMAPDRIAKLSERAIAEWRTAIGKWAAKEEVNLLAATHELLCRAVCAWAGVPLPESDVEKRTDDFVAMIEGGGGFGPRYWRGRLGRKQGNAWIRDVMQQVRSGKLQAPDGSALRIIAEHRDLNGRLLDEHTAAVELVNVLRPTVAVARFVTFLALALHEYPECQEQLTLTDEDGEFLVQEVRRFYPFFPFVAAKVRQDFQWKGCHFQAGTRTLLDLYGTNHDPRIWGDPEEFRPLRFQEWNGSPFNFIPQGGGDHSENHRCPGEWITIDLMKVSLNAMTNLMTYNVPEQDLRIDLSRAPTEPRSGFVIRNVRATQRP